MKLETLLTEQTSKQGALDALKELRQRVEGFIPFEKADYIGSLFDSVRDAINEIDEDPDRFAQNRP